MQILQANNAAYGTPVALFRDTTVSRSAQHPRVLSMGCSYFASQSVEDGSWKDATPISTRLFDSLPEAGS
jgi:hypothetical protein